MTRIYNLVLVSMLPFVYGCLSGGGGSGSSASTGSVAGGSSFSGGGAGIGEGSGFGTGGAGLETIHNPEPATMLLVGGGVAAMAYYRNLKK